MSADWHTHYPRVRVRVHALVGIQYGDAPIGDLRWEPPKPFGPWDGVRDASEYGAMCSQGKNDEIIPFPTPLSEDCELNPCLHAHTFDV
jgi:carboxylesterase type B